MTTTNENTIANVVANNNETVVPKRKRGANKNKAANENKEKVTIENSSKEEITIEEIKIKETTPKVSKFEKVSKEFMDQNNVSEAQYYKYLLKKSVGKKTNLNELADSVMNDSFFQREKMLSEIFG